MSIREEDEGIPPVQAEDHLEARQERPSSPAAPANEPETPKQIVSVNSRGSQGSNLGAKIAFVVIVVAVLVVAGAMGFNKWRATQKAAAAKAAAADDGKKRGDEASALMTKVFDPDAPPVPQGEKPAAPGQRASDAAGADADAHAVPEVKPERPGGAAPNRPGQPGQPGQPGATSGSGQRPPSRFAGDLLVPSQGGPQGGSAASQQPADPVQQYIAMQMAQQQQQQRAAQGNLAGEGVNQKPAAGSQAPANPPGSIGTMLQGSQTPTVTASLMQDRNLLMPKGQSIDCNLSMRLVNDVAGLATCVLSQDVYSDNGRVVLLERGSKAVGEYIAAMAQGQRRLFVLWTRVTTPNGVVINLASPAADALGTGGMDGYVDNHWWERLGAAFMLSIVQDAIAYETSRGSNNTNSTQPVIYQNTAQTGNKMAEKVLDSTINIKPTIYKNQGDRGTIFVARDLDFATVYALRAR